MADPNVLDRMRADWNDRAREDANYYVAFGRREQDDEEFFSSGASVLPEFERELPRLAAREAALEIGCGPGRLMKPLSRRFQVIHGIDVSDEMIRLAAEKLRGIPNAHVHATNGAELTLFASNSLDFVYSYAVFQHIPSREVVFRYLEEARRVLKPGGILRCQINGLPPTAARYNTWEGVRVSAAEIAAFAREHDMQLLALEGILTQYMWTTMRKQPDGWSAALAPQPAGARLRLIRNALTGEAATPASGPMSAISLLIERLPAECDLNNVAVLAEGQPCRVTYIGHPAADGVTQVNAALPEGIRTGLVPIEARWLDTPLCGPAPVRLIPPGPAVPRLTSLTDGVNLLAYNRTASGTFKAIVAEVTDPQALNATLGGVPVRDIDAFCADPLNRRYEFNFHVPVGRGTHELTIHIGKRLLARMPVEVV